MKSTIVPAQITSVEDKIAGNISFTQLLLLVAPVFLSGIIFVVIPPFVVVTPFKIVASVFVGIIFACLAIRVRGALLIHWLGIIGRFKLRPRITVYDKNSSYLRAVRVKQVIPSIPPVAQTSRAKRATYALPIAEKVRLEHAIADPRSQFQIIAQRGGFSVTIQEIKKEGF
jgi:hypothetical protein